MLLTVLGCLMSGDRAFGTKNGAGPARHFQFTTHRWYLTFGAPTIVKWSSCPYEVKRSVRILKSGDRLVFVAVSRAIVFSAQQDYDSYWYEVEPHLS